MQSTPSKTTAERIADYLEHGGRPLRYWEARIRDRYIAAYGEQGAINHLRSI